MTNKAPMTNAQKPKGDGAPWSLGNWSFVGHWGLVIGTFLLMLAATWLTWPDPIVDFGRELYVPWQITEGKTLYRDIAYFNGPLSPYFNALMFCLLGGSLRTLVIVNTILLAGLTWMILRLVTLIADRFTAVVAAIVLLTVFSFLQLNRVRNYNFITPYSHEITHGVILGVLGMLCLSRFVDRRRAWIAGVTGIVVGMIFLTKVEVFLAAVVAIGTGMLLARPSARALGAFAAGVIIPPVVALVLLSSGLGFSGALRGVLGSWWYVSDRRLSGLIFYQRVMGVDDPSYRLGVIIWVAGVYGAVLTTSVLAAMFLPRRWGTVKAVLIAGTIVAAVAFLAQPVTNWQRSLNGMTLFAPALAIGSTALAIRRPRPRRILQASFALFATILLLKIALNVIPFHYGFALAMPAALLAVVAIVHWLPEFLERRGGFEWNARAVALPVIALFCYVHLDVHYRVNSDVVAGGPDRFYSDIRGRAVQRMLELIQPLPPGATLAVIPEGVMINYLSRRVNPTPYFTLMPPEVLMFGADTILQSLEQNPPDYIITSTLSDPVEYGFNQFSDYAGPIDDWINRTYADVDLRQSSGFPFRLLRRR